MAVGIVLESASRDIMFQTCVIIAVCFVSSKPKVLVPFWSEEGKSERKNSARKFVVTYNSFNFDRMAR